MNLCPWMEPTQCELRESLCKKIENPSVSRKIDEWLHETVKIIDAAVRERWLAVT